MEKEISVTYESKSTKVEVKDHIFYDDIWFSSIQSMYVLRNYPMFGTVMLKEVEAKKHSKFDARDFDYHHFED